MRAGVAVSVIAHAALIAWGVFSLAPKPLDASTAEPVPVDLVTIDEVTAAPKAASPVVPPTPAPATQPVVPPLPNPAPSAPPPIAKADPQPTPTPPPAPTTVAKADPQPAAKPVPTPAPAPKPVVATPAPAIVAALPSAVAPPKPQAAPKPPATKPAPVDPIAAVLNQPQPQPLPKPAAPPTAAPPPQPDTAALNSLIASAAVDTHMTASEVDALRARIAACWTPPPGWSDPAEVRVVVIISLNADGSVGAAPQIVQAPAGRYQQTAPESAVRAILSCAPYALPPDKYDDWKQVQITFDPKAMGTG